MQQTHVLWTWKEEESRWNHFISRLKHTADVNLAGTTHWPVAPTHTRLNFNISPVFWGCVREHCWFTAQYSTALIFCHFIWASKFQTALILRLSNSDVLSRRPAGADRANDSGRESDGSPGQSPHSLHSQQITYTVSVSCFAPGLLSRRVPPLSSASSLSLVLSFSTLVGTPYTTWTVCWCDVRETSCVWWQRSGSIR